MLSGGPQVLQWFPLGCKTHGACLRITAASPAVLQINSLANTGAIHSIELVFNNKPMSSLTKKKIIV